MNGWLLKHCRIYKWNTPDPESSLVIISPSGDYAWRELDEQGLRIQGKLLEEYRRFHSLVGVLLKKQPQDSIAVLEESHAEVLEVVEQRNTWCKNTQEALAHVLKALSVQTGLIARLYDSSEGEPLFVPDTNALLYNHALESWRFAGISKFTVALTPTVLSELDAQKMNHRNEKVREKAEALIRQIKEYRRRGKLIEGVPLASGVSQVVALAAEAVMEETLPWFDASINDDRVLASTIELMRSRPRSSVVIVTRDINMQNKAEFARLAFVEPPEPLSGST